MAGIAPRTRQTPLSLVLFAAFAAGAAHADEGMWVPQQLPEIAAPLKQAGLRLDPAQLADLTGPTMGAVVSLGGCTATFVSPDGPAPRLLKEMDIHKPGRG